VQPVRVLVAVCAAMAWAVASAQGLICAVDLNGDGLVNDPGEQATCTTYPSGSVCPIQAQVCRRGASGALSCPGNPSAACVDTGTGVSMCSPNACMDPATIDKTITTVSSPAPPSNAGPRDATGACLGTLTIFPGTAAGCRNVGTETAFTNCCNGSTAMKDTLGESGGQSQLDALHGNLSQAVKEIIDHCTPDDEATDFRVNSGQCIYLGDYCKESWPIVGCVQSARSFCCFNSMLARIIQQQGRPQLPEMGGFGTPTAPNCRGFTPQEFQSLDFSKIDLSEYTAQIRTATQASMESKVNAIATQQLSAH
jgi:conjugal transfer mating pair stabilization protein TraN